MGRITVFGGPERRRHWSLEERRRILEEAFAPGACVARVARRHDVSTALVYTWRRKLSAALVAAQENEGFVEAVVLEESSAVPTPVRTHNTDAALFQRDIYPGIMLHGCSSHDAWGRSLVSADGRRR